VCFVDVYEYDEQPRHLSVEDEGIINERAVPKIILRKKRKGKGKGNKVEIDAALTTFNTNTI